MEGPGLSYKKSKGNETARWPDSSWERTEDLDECGKQLKDP